MRSPDFFKNTAFMGLLLAFALIMGYVELLVPLPVGIPGVKLGLPNLAVVITLYMLGSREALIIDLLRILLAGFMFGNLFAIVYSLAGGMLSFLVMYLGKRTSLLSVRGVSIAGGVFHNIGQLLLAAWLMKSQGLYYYATILLPAGLVTGLVIGQLSLLLMPRLERLVKTQ